MIIIKSMRCITLGMDETDGNLLESFADAPSNGKERETYAEQQRGWTEIISNINWW
mgnify:CR=1 FL=1